jgi:hypothetical protein
MSTGKQANDHDQPFNPYYGIAYLGSCQSHTGSLMLDALATLSTTDEYCVLRLFV